MRGATAAVSRSLKKSAKKLRQSGVIKDKLKQQHKLQHKLQRMAMPPHARIHTSRPMPAKATRSDGWGHGGAHQSSHGGPCCFLLFASLPSRPAFISLLTDVTFLVSSYAWGRTSWSYCFTYIGCTVCVVVVQISSFFLLYSVEYKTQFYIQLNITRN